MPLASEAVAVQGARVGPRGGQRFLQGAGCLGTGIPSGVQGQSPGGDLGTKSPEAEAFHLNRYKILSVHGRKLNELDNASFG